MPDADAPSTVWALCAVTIFGLSSLFHLYQLVKSRRWSYAVVLVGGGLQMAGWVERYYASQDITVGYVVESFGRSRTLDSPRPLFSL